MTAHDTLLASTAPRIRKIDPTQPAIKVTSPTTIAIRAGTEFNGRLFEADTEISAIAMEPGTDYAVVVEPGDYAPRVETLAGAPTNPVILGGFHFAPGGNAPARSGGDADAQINPCSLWDVAFRPACPDPRGMTLVEMRDGRRFWCDIYLAAADHLRNGTSRFGVEIADGNTLPQKPGAKDRFRACDYDAACAMMAHHGKGLLSFEEFAAAAYGVTEKTAHDGDPNTTQCDPAHTSKFGLMQATGNMWVWGHDGDPDSPRASLFGGSWWRGGYAGSRFANVAVYWPYESDVSLGARGRSDHLQLG